MKKILMFLVALSLAASTLFGCAESCEIKFKDGSAEMIEPYGLFNQSDKNPNVAYNISVGNVVLSVITVETVVIPVVLLGWYLFEPISSKDQLHTTKPNS